jgi:predicted RNA binding protein with dsRBD fold (UPF0201 family)
MAKDRNLDTTALALKAISTLEKHRDEVIRVLAEGGSDALGQIDRLLRIQAAIKAIRKVMKERGGSRDGQPDMEPEVPDPD